MTPIIIAVAWLALGLLALGFGVGATAGRRRADAAAARTEARQRVAAAILVPDHDLVTGGEPVDMEACGCHGCLTELALIADAGRALARETEGWLRDQTTPPDTTQEAQSR
ncbi:hypothetical protein [Rhizomonospora bruguierae]|uniref:hypothetical protein n=1 Tax=Rhizomonospora bruguierae TaxID=1581705 RepID=UPI001BCD1743|nr:hypothetical protein [Micromonospora sp. NBRC 107566]